MHLIRSAPTFSRQIPVPARRLAFNTLWLLLARLASQLLAAVFTILVARALGEAGLGQYALISSLIFLANVATTFGTDTLLIRELAAGRAPAPLLKGALWLQIGLSVGFILGLNALAGLLHQKTPETLLALRVYSLSLLPLAFYSVYSAALRANERMDLFLGLNLFSACLQTGGAAVVLLSGGGLIELTWLLLGVQVLGALLGRRLYARYTTPPATKARLSTRLLLELVQKAWPMALLAGLAVTHQRMGVFLLGLVSEDAVTGWYSAAARLVEGFKILHYALLGALFPGLARLAYQAIQYEPESRVGPAQISTGRPVWGLLISYAVLVSVGITILARPAIELLYGARYAPSSNALTILIWSLVPYTYTAKVSLELVARREERAVLKAALLAAAAMALLGLLWIPKWGLLGASLACLASEWIQAVGIGLLARASQRTALRNGPSPGVRTERRPGR